MTNLSGYFKRSQLVLAFLFFAAVAFAQQASIGGLVTDSTGAALPGTHVTATNIATNVAITAVTNETGNYLIPNLEIGEYSLAVEHEGFRLYRENKIMLDTAENLGLNVKMELGSVTESVTVSASAATLDEKSSTITQTFEPAELADIPLGDRRTMNLIELMPGAVFVGYDSGSKPNFSLAGGRTQSQMLWIDGGSAQNMRLGAGQMDIDPPVETVQEVKVLSNNYAAEYGASAGGVVLETTKSGGNSYHGSGYEFLRNNAFNAPGFFAPVVDGAKTTPTLRYNIFGATLGGPIRRNRTFFFFGYEGRRLGVGNTLSLTVPSLLQRTGDFSQTKTAAGAAVAIYDPATTQVVSGKQTRTQFPGNVIPQSRLDPVAMKMLNYWPSPNHTPSNAAGANNFVANSMTWTNSGYYSGKVDHVFNEKDRLTGRYILNQDLASIYGPYGPGDAADPTSTINPARQQYVYVDEIHVFDPATINDFRFNYGYRVAHAATNGVGSKSVEALGLTGVSDNAFPHLAPAGFAAIGSASQERRQFPIVNLQFVDNLSKIMGRHALKVGFEARKSVNNETDLFTASGDFTFATNATAQPTGGGGNGLATMLLGFPTSFASAQANVIDRYSWYFSAFLQDDFAVTRTLTLNLGIRWEMDTPMRDINNHMNGFDMNATNPVSGTLGVVKFMGVNGFPANPWNTDWNNFGPRFGFAWKPDFVKNLVLRGGYGVFFSHPFDTGQPAAANLGFGTSTSLQTPDNGITAPFYLKDGVPPVTSSVSLNDSYGAVKYGVAPTTAVTFFDASRVTGYSQQSNLSLQYQVSSSMIVEVSALTNFSHKLPNATFSINQIMPQTLGANCSTQFCRPYPQFSNVSILSPDDADSRYVGAFVRAGKRFSGGLSLNVSYTRASFQDNSFAGASALSVNGTNAYSNQYNRTADWGPSANDIRNRFSGSSIYELPFGPGKQWLSKGLAGNVIGGWTLGAVATVQSGAAFTVTTNTNNTNAFSTGNQRANVIGNPVLPADQRSVTQWFDITQFAQPSIYTFGNSGRDSMRAPGVVNVNLSLSRNFRLREFASLQFRGEFFNVLNHTNFSAPGPVYGSANFGVITAAGPARVMQVGAKLRF